MRKYLTLAFLCSFLVFATDFTTPPRKSKKCKESAKRIKKFRKTNPNFSM